MTEREALNNAIKSTGINLYLNECLFQDKRIKYKKYYLSFNGTVISPTINYDKMNHFILGLNKGLSLNNNN